MAWLQKRGGVWWVGHRLDGRQFRKSTGAKTRDKAEAELAKMQALEIARRSGALTTEYFAAVTGRKIEHVRLDAFVDRWIGDAEGRVGRQTLIKYKQLQREFLATTRARETGLPLADVTPEHISQFFAEKRRKSSGATVKGFRRILSSIFIEAANRGHLRGNPVALVKISGRKDEERNERRPFTLAEVRDLHAKAN